MTFRTSLLRTAERVRGIPGRMDLRQNVVTVRVREWTGTIPGEGTITNTDTDLKVNYGRTNPRVQQVSSKDAVASGGFLTEQDVKVGPMTPDQANFGVADSVIDPATASAQREIFFRVTGQGFPTGGSWFKRLNDDSLPNFSRMLYLRATADVP